MTAAVNQVMDLDASPPPVTQSPVPPMPARARSIPGMTSIQQWFQDIIQPRFDTAEARARMGSYSFTDNIDDYFSPLPVLQQATRQMRDADRMWNQQPMLQTPEGHQYALLGADRSLYDRLFSPLGEGSIRGCSCALAATAVGAGALGMPYAFAKVGVGLGMVTLVIVVTVSAMSLQVLMVAARYTDTKSYAALMHLSWGSQAAAILLDAVLAINGIGALVAAFIFEGDFVPALLAAFHVELPNIRTASIWAMAVLAWPLAIQDRLSRLRYVTLVVPFALLVTVMIVCYDVPEMRRFHDLESAFEGNETAGIENGTSADSSLSQSEGWVWCHFHLQDWLQATAIMVNALANHMNAVTTATQLDRPSVARIVKVTTGANIMVLLLVLTLGVAGYVSFGTATQGDFLLNYKNGRPEIFACRLMLAIIVFFQLPVAVLPTARSVSQLVLDALGRSSVSVSPRMHMVVATTLLFCCAFVALLVSDVATILSPLGGLLATSLMFWFPAAVYRKLLWPTQPKLIRWVVLVAMCTFGTLGWASVLPTVFALFS